MRFDFDSVSSPFRMQPGLRRIGAGVRHLTPQRPGDAALRSKLQVLEAHAGQALLAMPGFDARPALSALCRHATAEHPTAFLWSDDAAHALQLGWKVRSDGSLDAASHAAPVADAEVGRCLSGLTPGWRLAGL